MKLLVQVNTHIFFKCLCKLVSNFQCWSRYYPSLKFHKLGFVCAAKIYIIDKIRWNKATIKNMCRMNLEKQTLKFIQYDIKLHILRKEKFHFSYWIFQQTKRNYPQTIGIAMFYSILILAVFETGKKNKYYSQDIIKFDLSELLFIIISC